MEISLTTIPGILNPTACKYLWYVAGRPNSSRDRPLTLITPLYSRYLPLGLLCVTILRASGYCGKRTSSLSERESCWSKEKAATLDCVRVRK